ncbi:MAG: MFS transporter [Planctomycetaceae bacterium]|nr:MFS transporter [Planctomycetaceae bacterium]
MLGIGSGPGQLPRRVALIAGLLLAASAINYMDRQTLANVAKRVTEEFSLNNEQYGRLEAWFGYAFAAGSLLFGILADRVSVRWLYPAALLAWSLVGFATGWARDYDELLLCRTALGFFEAAHWPCALKTTQLLISTKGRALGNGILQSGTSIGSILTPVVMWWIMVRQGQSWRLGFQFVGLVGIAWIFAWIAATRAEDFQVVPATAGGGGANRDGATRDRDTIRRWAAVLIVVVIINTVWQSLRAWIPLILQKEHGYSETETLWFTALWFGISDIGCLASGALAWWLAVKGWSVKWSRVATFALACLLCLGLVAVPWLGSGPMLLAVLLVAGAGALGLFPIYYSFTQDISRHHQGLVTGVASFFAWVASARFQPLFGRLADQTDSFSIGLAAAGGVTLVALAAWAILWPPDRAEASAADGEPTT